LKVQYIYIIIQRYSGPKTYGGTHYQYVIFLVNLIREKYPSSDGNYVGFKPKKARGAAKKRK
jgi:hypothetical protein